MNLSEHYKFHSRKSIKPYSHLFIFVILAIITIVSTVARYNSHTYATSNLQVAKWNISVNGQKVDGQNSILSDTMILHNTKDDSQFLQSGDECYFDIVVDPTDTEVSLIYNISINLAEGTDALPTGTVIEKYEIYSGSSLNLTDTISVNATSKVIEGTCNLTNNQALDSSSIKKYRIYCIIPESSVVSNGQKFKVDPIIMFEQNI